jgi:hypothetical protein
LAIIILVRVFVRVKWIDNISLSLSLSVKRYNKK